MDSGSIERSKNSSCSVSGRGTCGRVATSTLLSFRRLSLKDQWLTVAHRGPPLTPARAGADPAGVERSLCRLGVTTVLAGTVVDLEETGIASPAATARRRASQHEPRADRRRRRPSLAPRS
jgi:hypothetical protein